MERNKAKKQNISISAEAIGNNIDLLTEILLRLAVKPLARSKCVSKQWLSVISDPQFTLSHNRHHHHHSPHPTPTALLLKENNDYFPEFEIVPIQHHTLHGVSRVPFFDYFDVPRVYLEQSCNGLLLFSSRIHIKRYEKDGPEHIHYICNPTTKKFKRLPSPPCRFGEYYVRLFMAFDPLKSNHYKVIFVCRVKNTDKCRIYLYSSETDSWRLLEISFTPPKGLDFGEAVFCNGAVHWYSHYETSLYFDVDTERFNKMPMPTLSQRCFFHRIQYFGESRGHLHLVVTEFPFSFTISVLEMAADYSGWFLRYHVNLDAARIEFPDIYRFSVLDVIRAQKEEDSIVVLLLDKKAIFYNVHDGTSKMLHDLEYAVTKNYSPWETFRYFESLASV